MMVSIMMRWWWLVLLLLVVVVVVDVIVVVVVGGGGGGGGGGCQMSLQFCQPLKKKKKTSKKKVKNKNKNKKNSLDRIFCAFRRRVLVVKNKARKTKVSNLDDVVVSDEAVARCEVSVNELLGFEKRHAGSNVNAHACEHT
jgi:hypothetical protein